MRQHFLRMKTQQTTNNKQQQNNKKYRPNTVTFVGFLALLGAYFLTAFYCSDIQGPMPAWAYLLNIFLLFWYQTLDAIDGKQARRTGSSSPLGELFDHGCDAIGSMLQTMTVLMVAQMGNSWQTWIVLLAINAMFFFSIWEQYYTHVLNFHVLAGPTVSCRSSSGVVLLFVFRFLRYFCCFLSHQRNSTHTLNCWSIFQHVQYVKCNIQI